jgi:hypothetical protein
MNHHDRAAPALTKNAQRPVFEVIFEPIARMAPTDYTAGSPCPARLELSMAPKVALYFTLRPFAEPSNMIAA